MTDQKYNGWTNYETWVTKLWMDNDEGSYNYWSEVTDEIYRDGVADKPFTKKERAALDLADMLKEQHEDANPIEDASVFSDLMGAALSSVNWYEIAESLIEDAVERDE